MSTIDSLEKRGLVAPVYVYAVAVLSDGTITPSHTGYPGAGYVTTDSTDAAGQVIAHVSLTVRGIAHHAGGHTLAREDREIWMAAAILRLAEMERSNQCELARLRRCLRKCGGGGWI